MAFHTANGHKSWNPALDEDLPVRKARPLSPVELRFARCKLALELLTLLVQEPVEGSVPRGYPVALQQAVASLARLQRITAAAHAELRAYEAERARRQAEAAFAWHEEEGEA
jgi:hypothetical protein